MIGFPIALIFANGFEWYAHKYILHGTPPPGRASLQSDPDIDEKPLAAS